MGAGKRNVALTGRHSEYGQGGALKPPFKGRVWVGMVLLLLRAQVQEPTPPRALALKGRGESSCPARRKLKSVPSGPWTPLLLLCPPAGPALA
jgi:hypothetical protein